MDTRALQPILSVGRQSIETEGASVEPDLRGLKRRFGPRVRLEPM